MDAKSGANIKTAKLSVGDKNWSFPIYGGTIGPDESVVVCGSISVQW